MALQSQLDPERIGIRQPLDFGGFKGRYRASVIKPDVLVELLRQGSLPRSSAGASWISQAIPNQKNCGMAQLGVSLSYQLPPIRVVATLAGCRSACQAHCEWRWRLWP